MLTSVVRQIVDIAKSGRGSPAEPAAPPESPLDRMLTKADAKLANLGSLVPAGERSKPRQRFTTDLPASETRMSLTKIRKALPTMLPLVRNMTASSRYYEERFQPRSDVAPPGLLDELEALARQLGAVDVGYVTGIGEEEIFAGLGIPHDNAVVFTVEMDRDQIATAPSVDAFVEVAKGYKRMAVISNAVTELLRGAGFAAYPGTALGGLTDYCALAERAGLGAMGYHGLLIAPQGGARLRINTVYTNIANLPVRDNPHRWVRDFCASCRNCVRSCPPNAIKDEPEDRPGGGKTCIDYPSCRNYFATNDGCAICVKVCPFSNAGYEAIREGFETAGGAVGPPTRPAGARSLPLAVVGRA